MRQRVGLTRSLPGRWEVAHHLGDAVGQEGSQPNSSVPNRHRTAPGLRPTSGTCSQAGTVARHGQRTCSVAGPAGRCGRADCCRCSRQATGSGSPSTHAEAAAPSNTSVAVDRGVPRTVDGVVAAARRRPAAGRRRCTRRTSPAGRRGASRRLVTARTARRLARRQARWPRAQRIGAKFTPPPAAWPSPSDGAAMLLRLFGSK